MKRYRKSLLILIPVAILALIIATSVSRSQQDDFSVDANLPVIIANDTFQRVETSGWGQPSDSGVAYRTDGTGLSVDGQYGVIAVPRCGVVAQAVFAGSYGLDFDMLYSFKFPKLPSSQEIFSTYFRYRDDQNSYRLDIPIETNGSGKMYFGKLTGTDSLTLIGSKVNHPTLSIDTVYKVRANVSGKDPTILKAKIWKADEAEPTEWTVSVTDSEESLKIEGTAVLRSFQVGNCSTTDFKLLFDDIYGTKVQDPDPVIPPPPDADITPPGGSNTPPDDSPDNTTPDDTPPDDTPPVDTPTDTPPSDTGSNNLPSDVNALRIFYVDDATGNDSNSGNTTSQAWKTMSKVNSMTFIAGDAVLFKRGQSFTYGDTMRINGSGTQQNPIFVGAYGEGTPPVLMNVDSTNSYEPTVRVSGDWVVIQDFKFDNTNSANKIEEGVSLSGDNITVRNSEFTRIGVGVGVNGANSTTISHNTFHDLVMNVSDSTPDNDYGAIAVIITSGNNINILRNHIFNIGAPSVDYGNDGAGLEIFGAASNITFAYNKVEDAVTFTEVSSDNHSDVISNLFFHHNIFLNVDIVSVFTNDPTGNIFGANITGIYIDNNTIVKTNNKRGDWVWTWAFSKPPAANTAYMRNNIFYLMNIDRIILYYGQTQASNNIYKLINSNGPDYTIAPSDKMNVDPLFVDLNAKDFRLQAESPARNGGVNLGYTEDFYGNPISGIADIGAIEYQDAGSNEIPSGGNVSVPDSGNPTTPTDTTTGENTGSNDNTNNNGNNGNTNTDNNPDDENDNEGNNETDTNSGNNPNNNGNSGSNNTNNGNTDNSNQTDNTSNNSNVGNNNSENTQGNVTTQETQQPYIPAPVEQTSLNSDENSFGVKVEVTRITGLTDEVMEGNDEITYKIKLSEVPTADVSILINFDDELEITPASIVLNAANLEATFSVKAVNDDKDDGKKIASVAFNISSSDTRYNGYQLGQLKINVHDNDETVITNDDGTKVVENLDSLPSTASTQQKTFLENLLSNPGLLSATVLICFALILLLFAYAIYRIYRKEEEENNKLL